MLNKLESDSLTILQWFAQNAKKANPDKSHLLISNSNLNLSANIGPKHISNENNVKLLGITFDNSYVGVPLLFTCNLVSVEDLA